MCELRGEYDLNAVPESTFHNIVSNAKVVVNYSNNVFLINEKHCSAGSLNSTDWVVMTAQLKEEHSFGNVSITSQIYHRLIQVVGLSNVNANEIITSESNLFNLKSCLVIPSFVFDLKCGINLQQSGSVPKYASKLTVCALKPPLSVNYKVIDKVMFSYFRTPRYLFKSDIFVVSVNSYAPEVLLSYGLNKNVKLHFKVEELDGPYYENLEFECGYFVNQTTSLYQVSNKQSFVPSRRYIAPSRLLHKNNLNNLLPLIPGGFQEYFDQLVTWFQPFMLHELKELKLKPLFLVSGPPGTGKTRLLHCLSESLGISHWPVDCILIQGSGPGQSEAKLKAIFSQLHKLSPLLLQLDNIEKLSEDSDGNEDIRTMSFFLRQLALLSCDWPVIIVATTTLAAELLHPMLAAALLQSLPIPTPSYQQRSAAFNWLAKLRGYTLRTQLIDHIAIQTAGFVLADLETLLLQAIKECFKRHRKEEAAVLESELHLEDFLTVLERLQSAYSDAIGAPKIPAVSWEDVGGLSSLKQEIIRSLKKSEFLSGLSRSGLLLHGPPGTGKTLLAKAVATECGRNFLSVKGPELLNMYVGQSEQNVREVFSRARAASPCIIFFDELDSLAPNRGRSGDSGGVMDRVVSQLLSEMDGLEPSGDVFVLGATNRPDLIDPALLRPGRLDKLLYVGPCDDKSSQLSVLEALTRNFHFESDVDLSQFACDLPASVTGAQLYAVCSNAWLCAARDIIRRHNLQGDFELNAPVTVSLAHLKSSLGILYEESLETLPTHH